MSKIIFKVTHLETQQSKEFELPLKIHQKIFIGRSEQCEIPILDAKLSRKHFSILWDGTDVWASDEKSTNGSLFLGSILGENQKITKGEKIEAGSHLFEILQMPEATLSSPKEKALPTLSPPLFDNTSSQQKQETPSPLHHQLDGAKPVEAILSVFKLAIKKPANFFEEVDFSGKVGVSLLYILGCAVIANIFKGIFLAPFQMVLSILFCGFLHLIRNFLKTKATFSNFIRFSAYAAILQIPFSLLAIGPFAIFSIIVAIYLIWVWLQVFKPNIGRFILVLVFSGLVFFGTLIAAILGIYTLTKNSDSSQRSVMTQKIMDALKPYLPPTESGTPLEGDPSTDSPTSEDEALINPSETSPEVAPEGTADGSSPPNPEDPELPTPPPFEEEIPTKDLDKSGADNSLAPPSAGEEPTLPSNETETAPNSP
jgi:pSer/pThr/pTyr-binding forkhead associated (FHA) protein